MSEEQKTLQRSQTDDRLAEAQPTDSNPSVARIPLVVIEPPKSWVPLRLGDLWSYRELLYFLTWRDVKVRYKQTAIGAAWAILQPLLMMLVFTLFLGRLDVPTQGIPYPIFVFAGLLPWIFFANAISISGNSLVNSANLITKVYFPRLLVPMASVGGGIFDFLLSFAILIGMMAYYRIGLTVQIAMLPVLMLFTYLFTLAVGIWLAALNVRYRDVRFALPFLIQIWLFVSSVIVPSSALPDQIRRFLILNPMSAIIEGYRASLFGQPFDWPALGFAFLLTVILLSYSTYSFRRSEKLFADII